MTASIPSPSSSGLPLGPFELHVYGLMYAVAVALAIWITVARRCWEGGRRSTRAGLRRRHLGLSGRPRSEGGSTRGDEVERGPRSLVGPGSRSGKGGLGIWGRDSARRGGRNLADSPRRSLARAVHGRRGPGAAGRLGGRADRQLLQPGSLFGGPSSLPWAVQISPEYLDLIAIKTFVTFHPTFFYELIWNSRTGGLLYLAGPPSPDQASRTVGLQLPAATPLLRVFEDSGFRPIPPDHIFGMRLNFYVAGALDDRRRGLVHRHSRARSIARGGRLENLRSGLPEDRSWTSVSWAISKLLLRPNGEG